MRRIFRTIRRALNRRPGPVLLMYHRIAEPLYDPWGLSVQPRRFEEQMRALKTFRVPLSLGEFVARLEKRALPQLAVGITFDDGYIDNLRVAKPILDEAAVPATIFLTTGLLGSQQEFWWDELARLTLGRREPAEGAVVIGGRSIAVRLPALPNDAEASSTWRAWEPPSTERERVYLELWGELRGLERGAREEGMGSVRDLLRQDAPDPSDLPMQPEDVPLLLSGDCIDIGAHSQTHQPLTRLSIPERRQEIEGCRSACEALIGKPIAGFAYPHGDLDQVTKELVRDSGFQWACSTRSAAVDPSRFDRFDLPRAACDELDGSGTEACAGRVAERRMSLSAEPRCASSLRAAVRSSARVGNHHLPQCGALHRRSDR